MGIRRTVVAAFAVGVAVSASSTVGLQRGFAQSLNDGVNDELLVEYGESARVPSTLPFDLAALGAVRFQRIVRTRPALQHPVGRWVRVVLAPHADRAAAVAYLRQDQRIRRVVSNTSATLHATEPCGTCDPLFVDQWHLKNTGQTGGPAGIDIGATDAWDFTTGDANLVVAVIDSGVDYLHEDLAANMWVNPGETPGNLLDDDGNLLVDDVHGYDFAADDGDPQDGTVTFTVGHGTQVAGLLGAVGNNPLGVTGVAWSVKIMALRAVADLLEGQTSEQRCDAVASAVTYAVDEGARIINMSIGLDVCAPLEAALDYAYAHEDANGNKDILVVAAAGNQNKDLDVEPPLLPATYPLPNIIAVAASDDDDELVFHAAASGSNYGDETVDIAAPGTLLKTTGPGDNYVIFGESSAAAALVSGAAALIWSHVPGLSPTQVKTALVAASASLPAPDSDKLIPKPDLGSAGAPPSGSARLDVGLALEFADDEGTDLVDQTECDDGIDNDMDGDMDYPDDDNCDGLYGTEASGGCGGGGAAAVLFIPMSFWVWLRRRMEVA